MVTIYPTGLIFAAFEDESDGWRGPSSPGNSNASDFVMHILIAAIAFLAALATWYARLKRIGSAARDIGKVAQRVRNAPRKFAFMRRAATSGLKSVSDPREAAAILMVLVAGSGQGRQLETAQSDRIQEETRQAFELTPEEAEALLTHAVWMVREVDVPGGVAARMAQIIVRSPGIGAKELVDLDTMLVAITEAVGAPAPEQLQLLQVYRDKAGLRA